MSSILRGSYDAPYPFYTAASYALGYLVSELISVTYILFDILL